MHVSNRVRKISLIGLIIVFMFMYSIYWAFFDIQRIKGQELMGSYVSPDATYRINIYLNNGGATVDYAVLGEVIKQKGGRSKNIYWEYPCQTAMVEWLDYQTVRINDKVLDVERDTYDYRHAVIDERDE